MPRVAYVDRTVSASSAEVSIKGGARTYSNITESIHLGRNTPIRRSFVLPRSPSRIHGINLFTIARGRKSGRNAARAGVSEQANQTVKLFFSAARASWPANFSPFSHEIDRVIHNIRAPALSISTFEFRSLSQTSSSRGELRRSHQKATRPGSLEFSLRTFTCFLSPCASIFTLAAR